MDPGKSTIPLNIRDFSAFLLKVGVAREEYALLYP
jgi:hypothetical protein